MIYRKSSLWLLILSLILGYFYIHPKFVKYFETKQNSEIVANCELAANFYINQFKLNNKISGEQVINQIISDFNKNSKNPVNKKYQAFGKDIVEGACVIEFDKKINTATISGYSFDKSLITRFVVKPPSYVRYDRD